MEGLAVHTSLSVKLARRASLSVKLARRAVWKACLRLTTTDHIVIFIVGTPGQSDNNYNFAVSDFILNHFLVTFLCVFLCFLELIGI